MSDSALVLSASSAADKSIDVAPLLAGGLSPHTFEARRQDAAHVSAWLRETNKRIDQLGELDVIAFRDWCADKWKPATVNRRLATLRLITRRLHRAGIIEVDPAVDVNGFAASSEHTPSLTWGQAAALVEVCRNDRSPRGVRDVALIRLGLRTGMRRAELLRLSLSDVTEHQGHPCAWVTVKRSKRLRVKLTALVDDLQCWADLALRLGADLRLGPIARGVSGPRHSDDLRRYELSTGYAARSFDRMVQRRGVAAQVPFRVTPHVLRASFVTLAIDSGARLSRIAAAVGHANVQTTAGYDARRGCLDNHPTDLLEGL